MWHLSLLDACVRCLCSGLTVSVFDSGMSSPGWSPDQGHCVAFLGKTLYSHGASLQPGVLELYEFIASGVNPGMDWHPIQGE